MKVVLCHLCGWISGRVGKDTNTNTNMNKTNKNTQEKICYVISVDG